MTPVCRFALLPFLAVSLPAAASELAIRNIEFNYMPGSGKAPFVACTVSWKNAWHTARNHDAVWLFVKIRPQQRSERPVLVSPSGHAALAVEARNETALRIDVAPDRRGVFLYPARPFRGHVSRRVKILLDEASFAGIDFNDLTFGTAYGVEMVYIPQGGFYEGDADTTAHREAAAFEAATRQPFAVESEKEIRVGPESGSLWYDPGNSPQYRGDRRGPIPDGYPKGYNAFYCMKYELKQGEYAAFLNSIYEQYTNVRANFGGRNYYRMRGTIALKDGSYAAAKPDQPANFISWDDGCAFADWACLRPLSELEYVKACRGPGKPVGNDYAWGTASKDRLARFFNPDGELTTEDGFEESMLTDANRDVFGASFFWVMDLSGGYWERVVGYGHENGRRFVGSHGDGRLSESGGATNEDWPRNETGGVGYKGGGYYQPTMRAGAAVPNSPVSFRPFAAWASGPRSEGYGFRAVRSAAEK
ncbi:SUMF1/EgtB/PvdO family nonheme iron enzyme [Larkinella soli]|uniref:SUMF1/EgtB/PvdO family nonheme iron enzyme n=1 Tax=Larkinella soli TaxID=1770527 RepID=UPI000FFB2E5B|nr:SUMF1/EgtB/PvdO family nonheme iron enzyme [Larkinella soli]